MEWRDFSMRIRAAVNFAGITAERNFQGNRPRQVQSGGNLFGAECKVTISQEGRRLSSQQTDRTEKNGQSARAERTMLRRQDEAGQADKMNDIYREQLKNIEQTVTSKNGSYKKLEDKYTIEKEQEVLRAMRDQKQFQMEESQRLEREAKKMAVRSSEYQEDIQESRRDLLTLLKSLKEADKTEEEQEDSTAEGEDSDGAVSGKKESTGGLIHNSALQFTLDSVKREWDVEEAITGLGDEGHRLIDMADSIARNILKQSEDMRAILDDERCAEVNGAEMMENLREGLALDYRDIEDYRGRGLQILQDAKECKIKHIADNPLGGLQETKRSMMLSAADAFCHDAVEKSLGEVSKEIQKEVEKLIDERNEVDKIQDEKEDEQDKIQQFMEEKLSSVTAEDVMQGTEK